MALLRYCLLTLALVLVVHGCAKKMDPRKREVLEQEREKSIDYFIELMKDLNMGWSEFEELYTSWNVDSAKESGDFDREQIELLKHYLHVFFKMMKDEDYKAVDDFFSDNPEFRSVAYLIASYNFKSKVQSKLFNRLVNS